MDYEEGKRKRMKKYNRASLVINNRRRIINGLDVFLKSAAYCNSYCKTLFLNDLYDRFCRRRRIILATIISQYK